MILVDTSVWIDHFRSSDERLAHMLVNGSVSMHPFIVAEIALGTLRSRRRVLDDLKSLPHVTVAAHDEVLALIERVSLFGSGIGYVDAHLLAATHLTARAKLWTRDKRLNEIARVQKIAYDASAS